MEQHNSDYADRREAFAKGGALQFALREVQGLLRRPGFWIVLAAAIAILVVSGPAGTLTRFNAAERTAYWATIAFSTFVTGQFATVLLVRLIRPLIGARMPSIALGALLAALPITAEVWLVNFVFPDSMSQYEPLTVYPLDLTHFMIEDFCLLTESPLEFVILEVLM